MMLNEAQNNAVSFYLHDSCKINTELIFFSISITITKENIIGVPG